MYSLRSCARGAVAPTNVESSLPEFDGYGENSSEFQRMQCVEEVREFFRSLLKLQCMFMQLVMMCKSSFVVGRAEPVRMRFTIAYMLRIFVSRSKVYDTNDAGYYYKVGYTEVVGSTVQELAESFAHGRMRSINSEYGCFCENNHELIIPVAMVRISGGGDERRMHARLRQSIAGGKVRRSEGSGGEHWTELYPVSAENYDGIMEAFEREQDAFNKQAVASVGNSSGRIVGPSKVWESEDYVIDDGGYETLGSDDDFDRIQVVPPAFVVDEED